MRAQQEIQRAHDLFTGIILGDVPSPFGFGNELGATQFAMRCQTDVLCWVLQHDHNPHFAKNIARIEAKLREDGYPLVEVWEDYCI
jgi:hypothetical protein